MKTEDFLVLGRIWLQQSDATVAKHLGGSGTARREQSWESTYHLWMLTVCCNTGEYQENHKKCLKAEMSILERGL